MQLPAATYTQWTWTRPTNRPGRPTDHYYYNFVFVFFSYYFTVLLGVLVLRIMSRHKMRNEKSENWKKTINLLQFIGQLWVRWCVRCACLHVVGTACMCICFFFFKNMIIYLTPLGFSRPSDRPFVHIWLPFVRFNSRIIFSLFSP